MVDKNDTASLTAPPHQAATPRQVSAYRSALRDALIVQFTLLILSALVLDEGNVFNISTAALLPYWTGFLVIFLSRPRNPTPLDLALVRIGYLPIVVMLQVVMPLAWRLRGLT